MTDSIRSTSKYDTLLDDEIWAFIEKTESYFPADAATLTVNDQRKLYNTMCDAFKPAHNTDIQRRDYLLSERNVPVREYCTGSMGTEHPTVIYYHGGGFIVGNLDSHDDVCADICSFTQFRVISCDYKLAPEFKHPAAFNDAYSVFNAVTNKSTNAVILAGDSAGATLAASVSSKARGDKKHPRAQVLIYPYLGAPTSSQSYIEHANAPMLSVSDMQHYDLLRRDPHEPAPTDDSFAPLWSSDFSNLPPTAIFTAQCDPLCDDGPRYAQKINQAGGKANCTVEDGLVHGYLRARHSSSKAKNSFERILLAIRSLE